MYKYPIIDLHATWLVINPIQGCPNKCKYCFLNGVNLTHSKPCELASPYEATQMLLKSKLYDKDIPICIESQSDAFSTPANISFVTELLKELDNANIMNPKVFITKCKIPDSFIELIQQYKEKGHKFVFFLSYSGLDKDIEIGINKENIKTNFIKLSNNNIDIVHYWRPFIPQNSSKEKILEVYNFVKKYAKCSIAIGMKVQDNFIDKIDFWPELLEEKNATTAECIWSKEAYEYIWGNNPIIDENYPIFQSTSCGLAYALNDCDRNAFYKSPTCDINRCPNSQRKICKKYYEKFGENGISKDYILSLITKIKDDINTDNIVINIDNTTRTIEIEGIILSMKDFTYLTQVTRYKIRAHKKEDDYYWNTSVNDAKQLYI